ncbi:MAG TPA: wax ester/triacylglycerol synthase domain-containing protein [Dermatophilaceae bacterium]
MGSTKAGAPDARQGAAGVPKGIDRAGPGDLMTLVSDRGPVPMNIAAALLLDRGADLDLGALEAALGARIAAVPRLRQRLVATPLGCGRPVWLDDPRFELARHLSAVELAAPGTWASLLGAAVSATCTRLDPGRPLWAARLITGLEGGRAALVIVLHHALADGIGGLAVLAALADPSTGGGAPEFPAPPPSRVALALDALRCRQDDLARVRAAIGAWAGGMRQLGLGDRLPVLAPATSLNAPTGSRRRLSTAQLPLAGVVAAAHRDRCTVNDLVLAAVTGSLVSVLARRGESPPALVVSAPVSIRRAASAVDLGNQTGVVLQRIPAIADRDVRLDRIAALSRTWRAAPRGQSAGPLAAAFRLLGAIGLYQVFIDHQRFVNTFVSNIRGPRELIEVFGHRVLSIIPVAVVPGNVGVAFEVLSYAGQLVVTVVADPALVPDQDFLTHALHTELHLLVTGKGH